MLLLSDVFADDIDTARWSCCQWTQMHLSWKSPPVFFCYFSSPKSPLWPWSSTPLKTPNRVTPSHPQTDWYACRLSATLDRRDRSHISRSL